MHANTFFLDLKVFTRTFVSPRESLLYITASTAAAAAAAAAVAFAAAAVCKEARELLLLLLQLLLLSLLALLQQIGDEVVFVFSSQLL